MLCYNAAIKSATDSLLYHLVALTYEKFGSCELLTSRCLLTLYFLVRLFASMNLLPAASSYFGM